VTDTEQIFQAIRTLPVRERLRIIERVAHDIADPPVAEPAPPPVAEASSLLGLFADEPELVDEVCRMAMEARRRDPLRTGVDRDDGAP
jgi:hypothetical protein